MPTRKYLDPSDIPPDPRLQPTASQFELNSLLATLDEEEDRQIESLKLYEPLPFQEEFHKCTAKECILMKGNRAGGSLAGFVEDARAVTGQDPYDKYPKEGGTLVCLGYGEPHIGKVIHKFLFRAGAFKIIRDLETNKWRVFRPWSDDEGGDESRTKEAKPAPPLIPPRFIEGKLAWRKRSEDIFTVAKLTTGWIIYALNSAGDPAQAQGFDVDLYHIDEDTAMPGWYEEAIGRTAITKGFIRWTALPHAKNDDILNLVQRANDEKDDKKPITVCVRATMFDNPYYPPESREANMKLWKSQGEDIYRKRALGEMTLDAVLMYPTFSKEIHNAVCKLSEAELEAEKNGVVLRTEIQKILTKRAGEPPYEWCRYMVFDPGHTVGAVNFFAVPPPELGDYIIQYDELYMRHCDRKMYGRNVEAKVKNQFFQDFIIDAHGGRIRELSSGLLPKHQFEEEMEERGIVCEARGSKFMNGSDDVKGREMKLRELLSIRPDGTTKFLIVVDRCPNTCKEFERFKKKTVLTGGQWVSIDEGNRRAGTHAIECCEYLAAHGAVYVKPPTRVRKDSWVKTVLKQRKQRALQRRMRNGPGSKSIHSLGPQGAGK